MFRVVFVVAIVTIFLSITTFNASANGFKSDQYTCVVDSYSFTLENKLVEATKYMQEKKVISVDLKNEK